LPALLCSEEGVAEEAEQQAEQAPTAADRESASERQDSDLMTLPNFLV